MSEPDQGERCECDRGPVAVCAFQRNTSLLIRRIGDMGHDRAADRRCIDCVADMAAEVAASPIHAFHPDFAPAPICGQPVNSDPGAPCTFPAGHPQFWHQHDMTRVAATQAPA